MLSMRGRKAAGEADSEEAISPARTTSDISYG